MKIRPRLDAWSILFAIGTALAARGQPPAAAGPDPREIPVPPIATTLGTLPGVNDLPALKAMPDVLTMNDGTKVTTPEQWKIRRDEVRRILEYYHVGRMPPAPGNVKGKGSLKSQPVLDGKALLPAGASGPLARTRS